MPNFAIMFEIGRKIKFKVKILDTFEWRFRGVRLILAIK